jgi:glycosyltransferase involved in cell wall biosynthesis
MTDNSPQAPLVALSTNSGWSAINYRRGLIRALLAEGARVAVFAPDGPHTAAIRELGVDFYPVPMSPRGTSPIQDLGVLVNFVRQFRKARPAAFLGFTVKPNIYGSIAARMCGIPVINNINGLGAVFGRENLVTKILTGLYKFALRRSAVVFFQNPDDRLLFEQIGLVDPERAALLPGSGVNLAHFAPDGRKRPGKPFTFLFAARLLWEKGVAQFADAARRLKSPDVRFQILGMLEPPGPLAVPESALREWEAQGIIDYLGSADDVRPHFRDADCVVLPSFYREGVPRVLLEASAMGIPVITTDAPGCREAVDDGATGFLCEPRSVDSLVQAMEKMMRLTPDQWAVLGSGARRKMEIQFDDAIVHRAYADALRKVGALPRI